MGLGGLAKCRVNIFEWVLVNSRQKSKLYSVDLNYATAATDVANSEKFVFSLTTIVPGTVFFKVETESKLKHVRYRPFSLVLFACKRYL